MLAAVEISPVNSFSLGTSSMATTSSNNTLAMRRRNTHQVNILGTLQATHKVPSRLQPLQDTKDTRTTRNTRVVVVATILKRRTLATRRLIQICNAEHRWCNDRGSVAQRGHSLT